ASRGVYLPCARVPSKTRSAVRVSLGLSNCSPSSMRSSSSVISSWILHISAFVLAAHTVVVLSRIKLSPVRVEKLVWWVRQRCDARLTLLRFQEVSSRIPLIALWSVVRREGFDRLRGKSSGRSFPGLLRRRIRFPDTASFGYNLGSSPLLQGSMLRSTARRLTPLRLREGFSASV